jgi:hypothetical protein
MPTTEAEEYVTRAEECLRLAGACIAESNRQILIYAAVHWRMLAEEAAGKSARQLKSLDANPASHRPGAEAHGKRTSAVP